MLVIRLSRQGKSKYAAFRIVVTEKGKPPKGKDIEILGNYDPHKNSLSIDKERLTYWISQGAKISSTINNLLVEKKIITGKKVKIWKPKKKKEEEAPKELKTEKPKETDQPKAGRPRAEKPKEEKESKEQKAETKKEEKPKESHPERQDSPAKDLAAKNKKTEKPKETEKPRLERKEEKKDRVDPAPFPKQ